MRCNNISFNNSQGHPGKEGPNGEKGHMVCFSSVFASYTFGACNCSFLNLFKFLSPPFVLDQIHLHKTFCINVDNISTVGACVYCNCVCATHSR